MKPHNVTPHALLPGSVVGRYRLLEFLAANREEVWKAERDDADRPLQVLLKISPESATSRQRDTFRGEVSKMRDLRHPGIASYLDSGETPSGRLFLVLEWVEGTPIDSYANGQVLGIYERVQLMLKVAEALDFAHRMLIIHLDLKPAHILVTKNQQIKLLDFGNALRLRSSEPASNSPGRAASLLYASPEQLSPHSQLTAASDIYSLGVVFYELLCNHTPFDPGLRLEQQILEQAPPPMWKRVLESRGAGSQWATPATFARFRNTDLVALCQQLRGNLEAVVLQCMEKDPKNRYRDLGKFSEDLRAFLDHRPVQAKRAGFRRNLFSWAGKYQLAVQLTVVLIAVISALGLAKMFAGEASLAEDLYYARTTHALFNQTTRTLEPLLAPYPILAPHALSLRRQANQLQPK